MMEKQANMPFFEQLNYIKCKYKTLRECIQNFFTLMKV